ncbi:MAG: ribose 5-phosphate isomerase A [Desulfurococcaceae archaeon]
MIDGEIMNEKDVELSKLKASEEACRMISEISGVNVVGLGTGSTVRKFIEVCFLQLRKFKIVASSPDTVVFTKKLGLYALDTLSVDEVDLYIDGADEVSTQLDMVKGRGGALLREKTLAYISNIRVYVVDYTKYTGLDYLYVKPIPIEVVPVALNYVIRSIKKTGLFEPFLRTGGGKDGPVVTDNGNYIIDLKPLKPVQNPREVHYSLKSIHGVVETGLFPSGELVDVVIVGYPDRAVVLRRQ